jgi:hypothetical protein
VALLRKAFDERAGRARAAELGVGGDGGGGGEQPAVRRGGGGAAAAAR